MKKRSLIIKDVKEKLLVDDKLEKIAETAVKHGCNFEFGEEELIQRENIDGSTEQIGRRRYIRVTCINSKDPFFRESWTNQKFSCQYC